MLMSYPCKTEDDVETITSQPKFDQEQLLAQKRELIQGVAAIMGDQMLMRDKELLFGLTQGQSFASNHDKLKESRA